jgi:hypothetical protein
LKKGLEKSKKKNQKKKEKEKIDSVTLLSLLRNTGK